MNFILLAIVGIVILYFIKLYKTVPQAVIPEPAVKRTDLYYGYYGCVGDQALQVKDHTNLHWESQFDGVGPTVDNILLMNRATVLDVGPQMFIRVDDHGKNWVYNPQAVPALWSLFDNLRAHGVLDRVKVLIPMDEPNINVATPQDLLRAINTIRLVAGNFTELVGFKLACIYAAKPESFTCIERFDYVAVDDYGEGTNIFTNGTYDALVAAKRPDAKTFIIPGGAFGQDPKPFLNFAHSHPEVAAVIPFCWFGPREPKDKWVGIGVGPLRGAYVMAGKELVG